MLSPFYTRPSPPLASSPAVSESVAAASVVALRSRPTLCRRRHLTPSHPHAPAGQTAFLFWFFSYARPPGTGHVRLLLLAAAAPPLTCKLVFQKILSQWLWSCFPVAVLQVARTPLITLDHRQPITGAARGPLCQLLRRLGVSLILTPCPAYAAAQAGFLSLPDSKQRWTDTGTAPAQT